MKITLIPMNDISDPASTTKADLMRKTIRSFLKCGAPYALISHDGAFPTDSAMRCMADYVIRRDHAKVSSLQYGGKIYLKRG